MNRLFLFFSLIYFSCSSSFSQSATSLDGQTLDLFHQSDTDPQDQGDEKFIFMADGIGASYDSDDGEWESVKYEFEKIDNLNSKLVLNWGGEYAEISLVSQNIFTTSTGSLTYKYFELNSTTDRYSITDTGTGNFTWSTTTLTPPINRFFEDDFSNTAATSQNFFLGNGQTYLGLTAVQDTASGEYTLTGEYTGDPDGDYENHRWVDISANSLLPFNRSWVVEGLPFINKDPNIMPHLGNAFAELRLEWDGDAYMEIGIREGAGPAQSESGAYFYFDPPGDGDDKINEFVPFSTAIVGEILSYRIVNDADDYEITCKVLIRDSSREHMGYESDYEVELFRIYWEEGSYATKYSSYDYWWNWKNIPNWKSLGDQYVQPTMHFELPSEYTWNDETQQSTYLLKPLEGGEIGFRSFNVIHNPETVEFDGGDEFPEFYNKLSSEVSSTNVFNRDSRYYLLKGLHELAQIVQSSEANSLKQLLVSLGFDNSLLNFSLSEIPLAGEYEFEINRDFQTGSFASTTQYFMIPRVESVTENFSRVTEIVTIETSMTGMDEAVVVDATDVKVLNAMANLLGTFAAIEAGYDFDLNAGHLQDLDMELEEITVQSFREKYPNLLGIRDVSMHRKAKVFLDSALSTYKTASAELRRQGRYETWGGQELDYLFVLHEEDLEEEEEFLADLQELHDALTRDYVLEDDDPEFNGMKISLSALFEGGLNFARLLPAAEGDQFVSDQLTDPTIGGILPGATYANNKVLKELRESFYDDELVLGQRVLPETLSAALAEFDPKIYLELNGELLDNWNVYPYLDSQSEDLENQARQHFEWRGFWEGRRYFYHPYEIEGGTGREPGHGEGEEGVALAPYSIDGMILISTDSQDPRFEEQISFDRDLNFFAKITNGEDNPEAEGTYTYTQYTSNTATLFLTTRVGEWTYTFDYRFNFDDRGSGTYTKTADYGSEIDETSGAFHFSSSSNHEDDPENDDGDRPDDRQKEEEKPEFVNIPISDVEEFVSRFVENIQELSGSRPMWAEKRFDIVNDERFVFEIGMDRGISLYFDPEKNFLHAANSDEFAPVETEFLTASEIPSEITREIEAQISGAEIVDAEKEFSVLESQNESFVYRVFFDANETEYNAHFTSDLKLILISHDRGGDFEDDWRPIELSDSIKQYIKNNYDDLIDNVDFLPAEERPTPEGTGKEIVVFLGDGLDIIFDSEGNFQREINVWKEFEENLDAGLKFDAERSSDLGGASVHIKKVNFGNDDHFGSLLYRISVTNSEVASDSNVSLEQMEIAGNLDSGQEISLTFTYEVGPPRYLVVSGSDVSAFKHRMPEWDKPGSFTIKAKTITPALSENNDISLASAFGLTVEMGGERFYEGTIFETNVINADVEPAVFSSPWDPAASFVINNSSGQNTQVKAHIPRRLLSGMYGIMNPNDVKSAIINQDGNLTYLSHQFIPYKGFEPKHNEPFYPDHDDSEYLLDDDEFGIQEEFPEDTQEPLTDNNPGNESDLDEDIEASKFDFDGDGKANSYLEVSMSLPTDMNGPLEVQVGDPFVDPFANLDESLFGSISGNVSDSEGNPLQNFDVWFFKVPEPGKDLHSGEPAFFNLERGENGSFVASLPAGNYHAEAFAYDPETDTPYKPEIAGGIASPTTFTIEGSDTSITGINFSLEEEFRMSHEFAPIEGEVTVAGRDEVDHVFFDLFPVNDGVRQTDYPVFSFGLERGGKIRGEAPVGTFEVEVFSPDNSLYLQAPLNLNVTAGETNSIGTVELIQREMVTVRGSIKDSLDNRIWAEVIFVDPQDDDIRFWPIWDESVDNLQEGEFALKVPQGSYKILAKRFDGLFKSAFYDADDNGEADIVTIDGNLTGIDFVLESRPSATVTIKLLDGNTSEPVKYAWFDFFDAKDEYAPIVFPNLEMIEFESDSFDGTYTLSVPGGEYKLAVGAHNYEGIFRVIDEAGNAAWSSGSWENGVAITLTDGETTALGDVNMTSFGKSEAELFGFDWLDEGEELTGGSTITGTVKTSSGIAVPKARIIAHTEDYLFWFDHARSRSDGSFELKNIPNGEWLIFAEPPFDSETFQGFRESSETNVSLSNGDSESVDLVLQGSNVFGRILFPQKNRDSGETKNQGLGHAFIWAYSDEDQDGEPDWSDPNSEDFEVLTEAFGETDQNGFFSLYLDEAGKYSLRIDIPGQLSALSPEPIGFTLKNPNDTIKLGNAIKIDWKSEVRATAFDIQRKLSTESSYVSLFAGEENSSKPGPQAKSFVDPKAKPGESYDYRVIAETTSGQVTVDSANVRVSEPIIYLAPPSKSITGRVVDADNAPISNAEVVAWREEGEGWSSTFTGDDGSFELTAGSGKWEVTVYRPYDTKVDWFYDSAPKRVRFSNDGKKESKTKNFVVTRSGGGKVTGSIQLPDGVSATDLSRYVFVDVFDPEGRGNWSQPDGDGKFEIPLQPGEYELTIWVDPELKGYGSPKPRFVRIGKNNFEIPNPISLVSRDQTLSGTVTTTSGDGLPNVEVWAWSDEGGWVSDTTGIDGQYSLAVSSGRWEIGFDLPMVEDGSEPPYLPSPPKRIRIKDGESIPSVNFKVRPAGAKISGTVYGSNGAPVSDLDAWVYAREYSEDDEYGRVLADVPLSSKGTFSFPAVAGKYRVGMWLSPGSGYTFPDEKIYTVQYDENAKATTLLDASDNTAQEISFNLAENNAVIAGSFTLSGQAVTGLSGEVYAVRVDGEGWQSTAIEDNGSYELTLAAGTWALDYYIEADASDRKIPHHPAEPYTVLAVSSSSVTQDFSLRTASASISGKVIYESNSSAVVESSLYIWAYREGANEYWNEVETDENGSFSIPVLPGGYYEVGAVLSEGLREQGYLDASVVRVNLSANVTDLNMSISKANSYILGTVLGIDGNPVADATVYAWADDGRENHATTDGNGDFNVTVSSGTIWHVGAEAEVDDNDTTSFYFTDYETDVDLKSTNSKSGLQLQLQVPTFELPEGASVTFDPSKDFVTKLPDGSEITILGGAANFASDVTEVRLVITPTAKGLSKSADEKPADYGYSLELFDNKGKKMEGNFKKDVIISIPVDINASLAKGMDINNVEGMYYSTTKDSWDKAKTSTWDKNSSTLTLTIDHFTTVAAVAPVDVADISSGVSKMDGGAIGDWYSSDWFGDYHDASSGWIYHTQLGWLYTKQDGSGNFWLYENNLGWLWTGPSYFEIGSSSKAHLYSSQTGNWYFFSYANDEKNFWDYSLDTPGWITP